MTKNEAWNAWTEAERALTRAEKARDSKGKKAATEAAEAARRAYQEAEIREPDYEYYGSAPNVPAKSVSSRIVSDPGEVSGYETDRWIW